MDLIRTESVVKRQGRHFKLGPVNLALRPGEVLGVIGTQGAGKTTLLRLIWGFLKPDQGMVSVFRLQPHLNQLSIRKRAGYLSESPCFESGTTARNHLQFVSHFYEGWNEKTVDSLLEQFHIDPGTCVNKLSRTTRLKLALISAAGHNPFLLLLDEPMAQLDVQAQREISGFLRTLVIERGIGIVISAQFSDELAGLADSTLTLIDGMVRD